METLYISAYAQLWSQARKVLGRNAQCLLMDCALEEGNGLDSVAFPANTDITLIVGNDSRSRALLCLAATQFQGDINVVELTGEYTEHSPLAVSDHEFKACLKKKRLVSNDEREKLAQEWSDLNKSEFVQIVDGKLRPLTHAEIEAHVLKCIDVPMRLPIALGTCMGLASSGWPRTDSFYLRQIEALVAKDKLRLDKSKGEVMPNPKKQIVV